MRKRWKANGCAVARDEDQSGEWPGDCKQCGKTIAIVRFSTVFEHRDRSRHRHRSIRRRKNDVRFLEENIGRASKKLFGPRKPRCVDFFMQTYSERYDFFDRFRSFSSTAIDRGIGIGRFGVEKTIVILLLVEDTSYKFEWLCVRKIFFNSNQARTLINILNVGPTYFSLQICQS